MEQVLLVVGAIAVVWVLVAAVLALAVGRAIRIADDRKRGQVAYRRSAAPRTPARRVAARAS